MITVQTCGFCGGSGRAESLEERTQAGDWVPNTTLDHSIADAWIAQDAHAPIRWVDCACPKCGGAGEYTVEHSPCRIF